MRNDIVHIGAGALSYEIRAIVTIAEQLERMGVSVRMENIGDPVAKGERIPVWIKEIVSGLVDEDWTYGYGPTRGIAATREFLAERTNARGGAEIDADDIIFFNGLGDAIQKVYGFLKREARVIGPSPTYSSHSSAEAAHAGQPAVSYRLDPSRGWYPDLEDLRLSVKYNPAISGILVINPDNPTGAVLPASVLEEIVSVAREHDLFLVCDEVYGALVYNGEHTRPISDIIGDVPALALKGISKELPWPGARCGWIEVYNAHQDEVFGRYTKSILDAKMVEVCSTTLPQAAIPRILSHPEYPLWLEERRLRYERHSKLAQEILESVPGIKVNKANGAFYMAVVFEDGALEGDRRLPIESREVRSLVEHLVAGRSVEPDKRFVYYLLASSGVCVVPLSSFNTPLQGFRLTLLERDEKQFVSTMRAIADGVSRYLGT